MQSGHESKPNQAQEHHYLGNQLNFYNAKLRDVDHTLEQDAFVEAHKRLNWINRCKAQARVEFQRVFDILNWPNEIEPGPLVEGPQRDAPPNAPSSSRALSYPEPSSQSFDTKDPYGPYPQRGPR
jgi:hypothetical protein